MANPCHIHFSSNIPDYYNNVEITLKLTMEAIDRLEDWQRFYLHDLKTYLIILMQHLENKLQFIVGRDPIHDITATQLQNTVNGIKRSISFDIKRCELDIEDERNLIDALEFILKTFKL